MAGMTDEELLRSLQPRGGGLTDEQLLRSIEPSQRVEHGSMQPGEVRSLEGGPPAETGFRMPNLLPTPEGSAFLSESVAAVPQAVGDFAREQAGITGTHYRKIANVAGIPGIDPPTQDAEAAYNQAVIEGLLTAGGGMAGKALGTKIGDAAKYIGRGFRTLPGAERFLASVPPGVGGRTVAKASDLLGPAISGAGVSELIDATDLFGFQPHELAGDTAAAGAGAATAWKVGKNTLDDLLVTNPRWQATMMKPSSGAASMIAGGLLGYLASRGIKATTDVANDIADYVADLLGGDDQGQTGVTP